MQRLLSDAAAEIAASIRNHDVLSRLGRPPLPSVQEVRALVAALREISFPGYHTAKTGTDAPVPPGEPGEDAEALVARRLPPLARQLERLVQAAFAGENPARAVEITATVIRAIPRIRDLLAADVEAAFRGDPAARSREEIVLCYPGLYALMVHRYAHELLRHEVPLLPRMMTEIAHSQTGIDLPPGATIGRGVFIDHGTGVVIGETCVIGDGCRIYQGVTLGVLRFERNPDGSLKKGVRRHPTLENNVTVYANATVLGGQTIVGEGSTVASGVCLTRSVPPGHLAAGPRVDVRIIPTPKEGT